MLKRMNAYDRALNDIKERLAKLGELTENSLTDSIQAFFEQNEELAQITSAGDEVIDRLDEALELGSLELISIQQPLYQDLRFLASAMRVSRELERIADYACDIARITLKLKQDNLLYNPPDNLICLADSVQRMLNKAFIAYSESNLDQAWKIDDDDSVIDRLFGSLWRELTSCMKKVPHDIEQFSAMILVSRYLERIGDHSVNIAEMCIFKETGERHPFKNNRETS